MSIFSIVPNSSPTTGGRTITIDGSNFTTGSPTGSPFVYAGFYLYIEPDYGYLKLGDVVSVSDTEIQVITPSSEFASNLVGTAFIYLYDENFAFITGTNFLYFEVTPSIGQDIASTPITIKGGKLNTPYFDPPPTITNLKIGGVLITSFTYSYYNIDQINYKFGEITCNAPPNVQGTVDIEITVNSSPFIYNSAFTYSGIPTITGFTPEKGPATFGIQVTIDGTNFKIPGFPPVTVEFDGISVAQIVGNTDTELIVIYQPPNATGSVLISVTNSFGTNTPFLVPFVYGFTPIITNFTPSKGPVAGGTPVTITGNYFTGTTIVTFGIQNASFTINLAGTIITAVAPSNPPGNVLICITNEYGTTESSTPFLYASPPTITSFRPLGGPVAGGPEVTIIGTDFGSSGDIPATVVKFGGIYATGIFIDSNTQITATTQTTITNPTGPVDIYVESFSGSTLYYSFDFALPPTITSFSPLGGPIAGGTVVTINGDNFGSLGYPLPTVTFGGISATILDYQDIQILVSSPPNAVGLVDICVTSFSGGPVESPDQFEYYTIPTITSIDPSQGPAAGGTEVTITGTDFTSISTVTFEGILATVLDYTQIPTQISVETPPNSTGYKKVRVINGPLISTTYINFLYLPNVPEIDSVDPAFGPTFGGIPITIEGKNFINILSLTIGGYYVENITVDSSIQITATIPAGNPGNQLLILSASNGSVSYPFEYISPNFILSPDYGPDTGGTVVTISGTYLVDVIDISINNTSIGFYYNGLLDTITIITPANAFGSVPIVLTWPNSITVSEIFTYTASPIITNVSPSSGIFIGGTFITITGTNFINTPDLLTVTIDGNLLIDIVINPITGIVTGITPANTAGSKTLELNTTGGTAFATFTYIEPTITLVYPNIGPTRGNTLVTLTGTNFVIVNTTSAGPINIIIKSITIGLDATVLDVTNNTITFLTPPGTGLNDIIITWWDGEDDLFVTILQNSYTYSDIPVITIVVPDGGIVYGGTPIKITGTSFTNPVTVTIDGVPTLYAYADETNTIVTTISPPGEIGLKTLILTTKSLDESEEYTVEASFTYFSPFPPPPFTDKICPGPPYNATNFTPENSFEYDKLVNYAKNSPNYPWDSGSGSQQIYKSQQNISYFNTLNQKTESVKTMNTDRITQGKLGNIPYPPFKSQTERLMYIQGLTLTASRNKITGTNPSAPMGVPCSTIYGIIYN